VTLRRRLALTVVAAAVPLVAGVLWLRDEVEVRRLDDQMREFARAHMEAGGRERCERDPAGWSFDSHRPAPRSGAPPDAPLTRLWAYRADLVSENPRAPALPADVAERMRAGAADAAASWEDGALEGRQMAVRMAWSEGPCAVVLVQRELATPRWISQAFLFGIGAVVAGLLVAVLAVAGPIVRSIRALTVDVRRSAQARYAQPVAVQGADEIARLAEAFNAAGADVRRHLGQLASREKTLREFVGNTTHDVMIPLTVLQGHLAKIRVASGAGASPSVETVRDALEEAHYIACLLQNLGVAAKLEGGYVQLERHRIDLGAVVERVVARHRPLADLRRIAIEHAVPAEPVDVLADVTLLEQAVSNVVHNAVRYGNEDGHVAIVLEEPLELRGRFRLRVLDDGPGIPEDEITRVVERRFRGRAARSRTPDGAGLGLSIAHDVAQRHGFTMTLARSEEGGLEVRFEGEIGGAEFD
jgi:signal transduction histidine kinase